jgi:hypothetical protein
MLSASGRSVAQGCPAILPANAHMAQMTDKTARTQAKNQLRLIDDGRWTFCTARYGTMPGQVGGAQCHDHENSARAALPYCKEP